MTQQRFLNRVALVTGGASGMGRQIALSFAAEGAKVVVGDIQDELGAQTVALITAAGGQAVFQKTDVSQTADVDALVALAVSHFGGLNHAVNAAAIDPAAAPLINA